jgi:hypothetical protein
MINPRALIRACRYTAVVAVLGIALTAACTVSASASTNAFVPPNGGGAAPAAITLLNVTNQTNPHPVPNDYTRAFTARSTMIATWWYNCQRAPGSNGIFGASLTNFGSKLGPVYSLTPSAHGYGHVGPFLRDSGRTVVYANNPGTRLMLDVEINIQCAWHVEIQAPAAVARSAFTTVFVPPGGGGVSAAPVTLLNVSGDGEASAPAYPVTARATTLTASWWFGCRATDKPGWFSAVLVGSDPTAFALVSVDPHGMALVGPFVRDSGTSVIDTTAGQRLDLELAVTHDCDWQVKVQSP